MNAVDKYLYFLMVSDSMVLKPSPLSLQVARNGGEVRECGGGNTYCGSLHRPSKDISNEEVVINVGLLVNRSF